MKKLLNNYLVFVLISLNSIPSMANIDLIISDIDDTIKITHSQNKPEALKNALETKNYFLLMPQLYNLLTQNTKTVINYVSNSPSLFKNKIKDLIKFGGFPEGRLYTRKNIFNSSFKFKKIATIIKKFNPKTVVLIGDNGQEDPSTYNKIINKHPNIKFHTYIRMAYRADVLPLNQVGFTTPLEVAIDLQNKGEIPVDTEALDFFAQSINKEFEKLNLAVYKKPVLFPDWYDCSDFKWTWNAPNFSKKVTQAISNIITTCAFGLHY